MSSAIKSDERRTSRAFRQLPLNGSINDYCDSEGMLNGMPQLREAIREFYKKNMDVNPRQLHYIITSESNDEHLMSLMGKYDEDRNIG